MGGGQFDKPNFILIIRKKIIPSQKLFMFKEFFDLWEQGNRLKMFLNRYEHSFMSKWCLEGNYT